LFQLEGTSQVKSIAAVSRMTVSADGHGVVSHAGMGMLRELADLTGLSGQVTAVLADTYRGPWVYEPGAVTRADSSVRSASSRSIPIPACDTTPWPSAETFTRETAAVLFTCEVPSSWNNGTSELLLFLAGQALSRINTPQTTRVM